MNNILKTVFSLLLASELQVFIQGFQSSQLHGLCHEFSIATCCKNKKFTHLMLSSKASGITTKGFGNVENSRYKRKADPMDMSADQVKALLLELLPKMKGTTEEFGLVEKYVNALEAKYIPPQTLDFLNLAMAGEWQFLFTTNQLGRPSPSLRLTELVQRVEVKGLNGQVVNQAAWNLSDDGYTFDTHGLFASKISYNINQGARMTLNHDHDLTINLGKGSKIPNDPQSLLGLIHRAMPTEMFDSSNLAIDTTYLDTEIRIVRFTGARHEGVRNIFMRKGAIEINPNL
jgi:hypothetical protein